MDGQAQDGFGPDYPVLAANQLVVSRPSACTPELAACTTSQQAARAQWVLRHHRELIVSEQRAPKGQADLAQVAQSPLAKAQHALEAVSASLEAVPATEPENLCRGLLVRCQPKSDGLPPTLTASGGLPTGLPGRPGWLPTQVPHRPVRAGLPHTVLQVTGSLRDLRPPHRLSGWVADNASEEG